MTKETPKQQTQGSDTTDGAKKPARRSADIPRDDDDTSHLSDARWRKHSNDPHDRSKKS